MLLPLAQTFADPAFRHHPSPVPEPRVYGAVFVGLCLIILLVRWYRKPSKHWSAL